MKTDKGLLLNVCLLILRVSVAVLMLTHGSKKLLMLFDGSATSFADPIGIGPVFSLILAVGAEFGCSILLIAGFFTRLATLPLIFTMLVAIFSVHWHDPFAMKELAVLYLIVFVTIAISGAGRYSFDNIIAKGESSYPKWLRKIV